MQRNRTIDFTKGTLVMFVLLGHLFQASVGESPWKWTIYGFHMPLFLGISGYLNVAPEQSNLRACFKRYGRRLLAPWTLAFVIYTSIFVKIPNAEGLLWSILHPWYHLWFVPVLFAYISASAIRLTVKQSVAMSLAVALTSQFILGFFSYPGCRELLPTFVKKVLPWTGDSRLYTLCSSYFFGTYVRSVSPALSTPTTAARLAVGAACGLLSWVCAYESTSFVVVSGSFLMLNLFATGCLPFVFSSLQLRNSFLEHLGRESLFYYLWHPLPFAALKCLLYPRVSWPVAFSLTLGLSLAVLYSLLMALRRYSAFSGLATAVGVAPDSSPTCKTHSSLANANSQDR